MSRLFDLARNGFGVAKSSVSRDFIRASAAQVKALAERRFDDQRFPVVMIDGVEYAGETMIVAMGITPGRYQADPGPAARRDRERSGLYGTAGGSARTRTGHDAADVGARRLEGAERRGAVALGPVRRDPTVPDPQERNVKAHVPEKHLPELDRRLGAAYPGERLRCRQAVPGRTVKWLSRINPDAAASLREGLQETLTVVRLGDSAALRRTLATTNPIESALSVTRRVPLV